MKLLNGAGKCFVALSLGFLAVNLLKADDFTWASSPASGNWNTTDVNWTGGGTVWTNGAANNATFGASDTKSISADAVTLNNLSFTSDAYQISGGPLTMYGAITVDPLMNAALETPITHDGVWAKFGEGSLTLDPGAAGTNTFYAFRAGEGSLNVMSGTTLVTQSGSNPETSPAFWVTNGTLVVAGGTIKTTGGAYARVSDYGHLMVTNGLCDLSGNSELLNAFNSPGITTVGDNGVLDTSRIRVVKNSTGNPDISGVNLYTGGVIRTRQFWYETADANRKATINLDGGEIVAKAGAYSDFFGSTAANWSNIFVNVKAGGAVVNNNGNELTIRANLLGTPGDGGFTMKGTGILKLRGANTYNGGNRLYGGALDIASDGHLGAVPASPETNIFFYGNTEFQSSSSLSLDANRTIWITNGVTASFDTQSYTQTVYGVFAADGDDSYFQKYGSGMLVLDPGESAVNVFGTLHNAAGTTVLASGTNLVTDYCGVQNGPGLRVSGGTLIVAGGVLKTTVGQYVNVDGGHLLVTNGIADLTSCDELLNGIGSTYGYTTVSDDGLLIVKRIRITQNKGNPSNTVVNVNTGGVLSLESFYIDIKVSQKGMLFLNGGTVEARINTANFLGTTEAIVGNDNDKWLTNIFVHVQEGGAIFDTAGHSISIKNPLYTGAAVDGGLTKQGLGTLTILNTNTYNGVTSVEGGTLVCGRNNFLLEGNTVLVSSNAVFNMNGKTQTLAGIGGSGTITNNATLTVTDSVAPGSSTEVGTLTLTSSCSLSGTLNVDVTTEGGSDQLHVEGDLDISGLALSVAETSQLARYKRYTIATCTGVLSGFFTTDNLPSPWIVDYSPAIKAVSIAYNAGTVLVVR